MPVTIHQCARCELRFRTQAELKDHLDHDHHVPHELLEQLRYRGAQEAEPLYRQLQEDRPDVHRVLLIANQTLDRPEVAEVVRPRRDRPVALFVLVPATPSAHLVQAWDGSLVGPDGVAVIRDPAEMATDDAGVAQARYRLRRALERLAGPGVAVHGQVGDPDPVRAAAGVLARERFDEIVMMTLPSRTSQWLAHDVPERMRRMSGLEVRTVTVTDTPVGAQA